MLLCLDQQLVHHAACSLCALGLPCTTLRPELPLEVDISSFGSEQLKLSSTKR
jgi:hypothetical protein